MKPGNLKFSYLYRDEGNYKEFGELVFPNPSGMSPEAASERLRDQLLDGEYLNGACLKFAGNLVGQLV